jgi:hypothetical protein
VPTVLDATAWRSRRAAHERRVEALVGDHLSRRRSGRAHPVEDFLFTNSSYRPMQLRRWRPAASETLADADPEFGGMHKWAMVYRQNAEQVRHAAWPLRLSPDATAAVVDANRVRRSHFDAFRFFTPAARPLNVLQPARDSQPDMEQPGCLHANMDLSNGLVDSFSAAPC